MKPAIYIYLLLVLPLQLFHSNLHAQNDNIVPNQLLVMLDVDALPDELIQKHEVIKGVKTGLKLKKTLSKDLHIFLFHFNERKIARTLITDLLMSIPYVKLVQANHFIQMRDVPNDEYFNQQWSLKNTGQEGGTANADIDAENAWNITTGGLTVDGDTIVVAVIDEGFDLFHQDLSFWKNNDEIPNNNIDDDQNGYVDDYNGWNPAEENGFIKSGKHGTHVAGIISSKGNNGYGVSGVNWNTQIMPVITDAATEAEVVQAYTYVLKQRKRYNETDGAEGAFVVATNASFGLDNTFASETPLWCAIYDSLGAVGILNVGATTNNNVNVDITGDIPSNCTSEWLIITTNTDINDNTANAGYGSISVDLGAPGEYILSTIPNNQYGYQSGTSMSSPHVAGAIALMYAVNCEGFISNYKNDPKTFSKALKDTLLNNLDNLPVLNGITKTGGRLNLYKAVSAIYNSYAPTGCTLVDTTIEGIEKSKEPEPKELMTFTIDSLGPNPVLNEIRLNYYNNDPDCKTIKLQLIDFSGKEVWSQMIVNEIDPSNLSTELFIRNINLKSGLYFFNASCNGYVTKTQKVVILNNP